MGTRAWVVACTVAASTSVAHAERTTLRPSNVALQVPAGWQVLTERGTDFLHWESASDGGKTFDLSLERIGGRCKEWRAEAGAKKQFPTYWPRRARTHLYVQRGDGKLDATGCLADGPSGALLAHLEITAGDPAYTPDRDDTAILRDVLAAALTGAATAPAAAAATTTPAVPSVPTTPLPTTPLPTTMPPPTTDPTPVPLDPDAIKGGTTITVPRLELAVRLPKGAAWYVGTRGEATITRASGDRVHPPALAATLFPLTARTCAEWRVDMSATEGVTYDARPAYMPAAAKTGVFVTGTQGLQAVTCVATKVGTLGVAISVAAEPSDEDTTLVRQLVEAIAIGASKHGAPLVTPPAILDAGASADATIGSLKLPAGARWRVESGAIERFDTGPYFTLSAMSRSSCTVKDAKEVPFLPAGIAASTETRPWSVTVIKACVQVSRTIELTLAYDGTIAPGDHALIRALVDAITAAAKKPASKS